MKTCGRHEELTQALRSGHWPQASPSSLREHVVACKACSEHVRLTTAFTAARASAMRLAIPQSPGLLWWKAQLRRRREAMEKIERPAIALPTATITASLVLLLGVLLTVRKHIGWPHVASLFSPAGWNIWTVAAVVFALCGFAVVAVVVGLGLADEPIRNQRVASRR